MSRKTRMTKSSRLCPSPKSLDKGNVAQDYDDQRIPAMPLPWRALIKGMSRKIRMISSGTVLQVSVKKKVKQAFQSWVVYYNFYSEHQK